jgi:hypothetical protein
LYRPGHEQTPWPNWRRAARDKPADFSPVLPIRAGGAMLMQTMPAAVSVKAQLAVIVAFDLPRAMF